MADQLTDWIVAYRKAWETNDPEEIRALFADDARYFPEPFTAPYVGHVAIVENWLRRRDEPGTTAFTWTAIAQAGELHFVRGETSYRGGPTYSNLWVIRLDDTGRAIEFTEWWMDQSSPS